MKYQMVNVWSMMVYCEICGFRPATCKTVPYSKGFKVDLVFTCGWFALLVLL